MMPSFAEALRYWLKLGFISFGGPAGQIALMHRDLVEKRGWFTDAHFLHALNFCMLLPGPEAQQLAIYLGWRLHGAKGGIAAGALFVLPAMVILFALSWAFMVSGAVPWLAALFAGLLPAVIAIVASAMLRIGRRVLRSGALWVLATTAFVSIYFLQVSFVWIVVATGLIGWWGSRRWPNLFPAGSAHSGGGGDEARPSLQLPPAPLASVRRTVLVSLTCLTLWWLPVFVLAGWLGWGSTPVQQGFFFSKAALVTFGGAYAVLPYVAQQAVEQYAWLSHAQMMSGLALAESTPGPLIMVLQFVGFVGGWQHPGAFSPLMGAAVGSVITTWVTFLPCFLLVFLGGPHIEQLRHLPRVNAALTAITAAVVGVMLNLSVKFATQALWPSDNGLDGFVVAVALLAFIAIDRFKVNVVPVIASSALLGLLWYQWVG